MTHLLRMRVCCLKTYYQLTYIPITPKQWNMKLIMTLRKCLMQRALLTLSISLSRSPTFRSWSLQMMTSRRPGRISALLIPTSAPVTGRTMPPTELGTATCCEARHFLYLFSYVWVHCSHIIQHEKLTVAHANDQMRYFPTSGYSTRFRSCLVKAVKLIKNSWPRNMLSVEEN